MRTIVLLLLAAVCLGCDHNVTAPVLLTGSFMPDGQPGAVSASSDRLILSRQISSGYAVEARTQTGDMLWRFPLNPGEVSGRATVDSGWEYLFSCLDRFDILDGQRRHPLAHGSYRWLRRHRHDRRGGRYRW